jgi:hypothetical protein
VLAIVFAIVQNKDFNAITEDESNQALNRSNQSLRFPESVFFASLLVTILLSWSAFLYLLFSRTAQDELLVKPDTNLTLNFWSKCCGFDSNDANKTPERKESIECSQTNIERISRQLSTVKNVTLQTLILICCTITFGILPPIQPYACLPLGRHVLNYSVLLTSLAYPFGCAIALKRKCRRMSRLLTLFIIALLLVVFIFWTATYSPRLPTVFSSAQKTILERQSNQTISILQIKSKILKNVKVEHTATNYANFFVFFSMTGDRLKACLSIAMIMSWFLATLILSYVRTMITVILNEYKGSSGLFRIGIYTQIGSIVGAFFMFLAINHLKWFKQTI